jgi:radical SAM superfamily enzyme YgiQ (UPF0313 family)
MKAILVQPPFAQLNAPYPSVHYLEAFLRNRGIGARSFDHSIELYRRIFSRRGLERIFADVRAGRDARALDDETTLAQIERYLSYEELYLEWIDGLVDFLTGRDPGMAHRLASAVELPHGERAEAFLVEREGRIRCEEAGALATRVLDDVGDLISYALDPQFGTVRYAERIASSRASFAEIRSSLETSYMIRTFYAPYLADFWPASAARPSGESATAGKASDGDGGPEFLVLITLPFPGCLAGGLACAAAAREALGDRAVIVAGGGYISTELRGLNDPGIFDYFDILSFDAGYGSLGSIIDALPELGRGRLAPDGRLYKSMYRDAGGRIVASGFSAGDSALADEKRVAVRCDAAERFAASERTALETTFPDYRSADFGRYLRIVDSENPMHRLWSDSPWLKYALARGCYWRNCTFCDTDLEYVSGYVPARVDALAHAAGEAAERTGLYGIHFVDEAMPMASLLAFARINRERAAAGKRPFHFWGNVRYDVSWTADRCEFLAASGLVAVSGGIEIATERGLKATGKGFDLAGLVLRLVALKRAGLLVHAYLIYGFPGQTEADIIESAEICRQLFGAGLVDSAFWHRFVLTRHSRMYREWREGKRPGLRPIDRPWTFASNDLDFAGSNDYDRFDVPLSTALDAWMEGEGLDKSIAAWFGTERGKRRPAAPIDPDRVESLIASAEAEIDGELGSGIASAEGRGRCYWIAGRPKRSAGDEDRLTWTYRGESVSFAGNTGEIESATAAIELAGRPEGAAVEQLLATLGAARKRLKEFQGVGLVVV